ncbi:MAG TPA: hypothetical protein VHX19_17300, partial [Stellaceae bacterium]|nr:hypothetical protein [Stellaceae bacterium]
AKSVRPDRPMKDAFDEWLARIVCYVFSVPPSAFTGQVNRATADTAQDVALSEGMAPLQLWVKHIVDRVLAEDFASPDLEFAWDQDKDTDPAATASIASDYVKSGIKSINEIRAELGLPAVAGGEVPKIQTAQGLMPLTQAPSAPPAGPAAKVFAKAGFDPDQPRGDHGMCTSEGGGDSDRDGADAGTAANGNESSDGDAGTSSASSTDTPPKPIQVADSGQIATDATLDSSDSGQVAQSEEPIALGLPTARVVLDRQVETGVMTRERADELLAGIQANDAEATARLNAAVRGYVRIPDNWTATPDKDSEGGIIYRNPDNPKYDTVRIMPGDPQRSNPAQREPYVIDQQSGNFLTTDGSRVQGNYDETTHIPLQDYRFDKR